ncbi:MAG: hypothetical protein QW587_04745 [Candidatus Bathyarchaeia archaeon]
MPKTEVLLLSGFVAAESVHGFSAFEPSVFTIRALAVPQGEEAQIRLGYIPSVIFSLGLGGIVSLLVKDKLPILAAAGASVFMITVYELSLRAPILTGEPQIR